MTYILPTAKVELNDFHDVYIPEKESSEIDGGRTHSIVRSWTTAILQR